MRNQPTPDHIPRTGDCYAKCVRYISDRRRDEAYPLLLVHGRPILQREPYCEYGHAWIEYDDPDDGQRMVIDPQAGSMDEPVIMPAILYYGVGSIRWQDTVVYTYVDTCAALIKTGHFGPWEGPDAEDFKPGRRYERMDKLPPVNPEQRLHEIMQQQKEGA
ncbi:MAG TPA: hypothetical protein VNA25_04980 [Phycisphaerae bacterium]|nr:hypothetical protein [Phycisphaerae bacterium]